MYSHVDQAVQEVQLYQAFQEYLLLLGGHLILELHVFQVGLWTQVVQKDLLVLVVPDHLVHHSLLQAQDHLDVHDHPIHYIHYRHKSSRKILYLWSRMSSVSLLSLFSF